MVSTCVMPVAFEPFAPAEEKTPDSRTSAAKFEQDRPMGPASDVELPYGVCPESHGNLLICRFGAPISEDSRRSSRGRCVRASHAGLQPSPDDYRGGFIDGQGQSVPRGILSHSRQDSAHTPWNSRSGPLPPPPRRVAPLLLFTAFVPWSPAARTSNVAAGDRARGGPCAARPPGGTRRGSGATLTRCHTFSARRADSASRRSAGPDR